MSDVKGAPRCRMCARPAQWFGRKGQWAAYCAGKSCSNPERICQRPECGRPFVMGIDGAGNKYCSLPCKDAAYHPTRKVGTLVCAWGCGATDVHNGRRHNSGNSWPYICASCIEPIKHVADALKRHKVSHERARKLRDDPRCEACGEVDLLVKARESSHGSLRSMLVVDHDHTCCPGAHSCGRCVRGLICRDCNSAAGLLVDSPNRARALAAYLDSWIISRVTDADSRAALAALWDEYHPRGVWTEAVNAAAMARLAEVA